MAKKKKEAGSSEEPISFNKQLIPVLEIADAILAGDEEAAMAELPEEVKADQAAMGLIDEAAELPPEDAPPMEENAEGVNLAPLEKVVGSPEAAARIWEASRQRDDLAAMDPSMLAEAIEKDVNLLMELEKLAARNEGDEEMPMEEMPPDMMAAGPDMGMGMGAPAGAPPMGPGGPGGMMPGGY